MTDKPITYKDFLELKNSPYNKFIHELLEVIVYTDLEHEQIVQGLKFCLKFVEEGQFMAKFKIPVYE